MFKDGSVGPGIIPYSITFSRLNRTGEDSILLEILLAQNVLYAQRAATNQC